MGFTNGLIDGISPGLFTVLVLGITYGLLTVINTVNNSHKDSRSLYERVMLIKHCVMIIAL